MNHSLEYFIDLAGRVGHWSYAILFAAAMLECAAFLGILVPGETLVVVGGFLASQRILDLDALIVAVAVGAILGDNIGYGLGRRLGTPWLLRYGKWVGIREKQIDRAKEFYGRHGGKTVFLGRFVGFLRIFAPFLAGASGMRYRRFFIYDASGAILWAAAISTIGYLSGESWKAAEKWIGRSSAIIGGVFLLVLVLAFLWSWAIRREAMVRQIRHAATDHPRIVALREFFRPQFQFLQARLTPGGYCGLHLTVGVAVIILGCWWFGGIVEDLLTKDPLYRIDQQLANWLHDHATARLTAAAKLVTDLGSVAFLGTASLLIAFWLVWRRSWNRLLIWILSVGGGALLNLGLKNLFDRQRPFFEDPILTLSDYSFPSGHTMGATIFYGLLAVFVATRSQQWHWRVFALLCAFLVILLVAATRIYLGAHYLSDVMGAMAVGAAWLAFCVTAVETMRWRSNLKNEV